MRYRSWWNNWTSALILLVLTVIVLQWAIAEVKRMLPFIMAFLALGAVVFGLVWWWRRRQGYY